MPVSGMHTEKSVHVLCGLRHVRRAKNGGLKIDIEYGDLKPQNNWPRSIVQIGHKTLQAPGSYSLGNFNLDGERLETFVDQNRTEKR